MQTVIPNEILLAETGRILASGQDVELLARGSSMHPFIIGDRDSVILRKVSEKDIRSGDILLAEVKKGRYVLHRAIRVDCGDVTLMGDGNLRGTELCGKDKVLGKVVHIVSPDGQTRTPGRAILWRRMGYLPRRVLLALYRRIVLKNVY
ncbi:MAG: S24/S26 family peptidase [Bacteroidales bacterium]|nr:S24/S26 family peptidase [Bacteroidales bacterium]